MNQKSKLKELVEQLLEPWKNAKDDEAVWLTTEVYWYGNSEDITLGDLRQAVKEGEEK